MLKERSALESFITEHVYGPGLSNHNAVDGKRLIGELVVALKIQHAYVAFDGVMCYNLTIKDERDRRTVAEGVSKLVKESRS
jgi:hypothetical protein